MRGHKLDGVWSSFTLLHLLIMSYFIIMSWNIWIFYIFTVINIKGIYFLLRNIYGTIFFY